VAMPPMEVTQRIPNAVILKRQNVYRKREVNESKRKMRKDKNHFIFKIYERLTLRIGFYTYRTSTGVSTYGDLKVRIRLFSKKMKIVDMAIYGRSVTCRYV
jgi:hypothetical protein